MKINAVKIQLAFLGLLAFAVCAIWYAVFYVEARENLRITFFDIGQGDSELVEFPNGNQVLIDGGPDARVVEKLGSVMPFWDRSLDLVILTHPHVDHLAGLLEVLKRYNVGMIMETGVNYSTSEYAEWHKLLKEKGIPIIIAKRGQRIVAGQNSFFDVLTPFDDFVGKSVSNVHDAMIVSRLRYGSTTVLFTGDAEKPVEYRLLMSNTDLVADILKVGHHGSKTSTTEDFLTRVHPRFAVISVGKKNKYGHPHQGVIDRLKSFGIETLRTDENGGILFVSDGVNLWRP